SNELGGEVITNERVMCRMAYLVARLAAGDIPSRQNHQETHLGHSMCT
ncbi:hypothetical protein ACN38_g6347, partial [Penicillium nordicum]